MLKKIGVSVVTADWPDQVDDYIHSQPEEGLIDEQTEEGLTKK